MRQSIVWLVTLALTLTVLACGDKVDPAAEKLCTEAADKYIKCVDGMLGKEMADMARSKRKEGIKACAKDKKTIDMYKVCLPKAECDAFTDCMMEYAGANRP
jgi:Cys-rich protein (TIGR04453 family)